MPRGRTKASSLVVGSLGPGRQDGTAPHPPPGDESQRRAIIGTLEDYARAWYSGDAVAMERCFHPDLAGSLLQSGSEAEGGVARVPARGQGIQSALGPCTHPAARVLEATVLDLRGHSASARILLRDWAAYVHLVSTGDRWAIVNVLWEWLSPKGRRSA